jgi:hypothetical protein
MKKYCPKCNAMVKSSIKPVKETYNVWGKVKVTVAARVLVCNVCKSQIFDEKLDSVTLKKVYRIARVKGKSLIPKNDYYCYKRLQRTKDGKFKVIGQCPFWSINKDLPKQANGYCSYLGKLDVDIHMDNVIANPNNRWRDQKGKFAKDPGTCSSLLWDRCKECGINR